MRNDRGPGPKELDAIIDAALPGYSQADPRPGLEQRVIARSLKEAAGAERSSRKGLAWLWALTVPAIVCLLIFLLVTGRHKSSSKTLETAARNAPAIAEPFPKVVTDRTSSHSQSHPHSLHPQLKPSRPRQLLVQLAASTEALPKEEVFPTPSPLTAEEQAVLRLRLAPAQLPAQSAIAAVEIPPLYIAELQIKPIAPPADDSSRLFQHAIQPNR